MRGLFFPFWIPPPSRNGVFHPDDTGRASRRGFRASALLEHFDGVDS